MEGLTRRFFEVVTKGNEGKGTSFTWRFERPQGGPATVDGRVRRRGDAQRLIRMGMRSSVIACCPTRISKRTFAGSRWPIATPSTPISTDSPTYGRLD